jgi:hypothetical protein
MLMLEVSTYTPLLLLLLLLLCMHTVYSIQAVQGALQANRWQHIMHASFCSCTSHYIVATASVSNTSAKAR